LRKRTKRHTCAMGGGLGEGIEVGVWAGLGGQVWAEGGVGYGEGVLTGTYRYPISGELREEGEWGVGRWGTSR